MPSRKSRTARRRPAEVSPTPASNDGWWSRLPDRTQHGICIALLIAVSLGFFAPIHFTDLTLIGGDTVEWRAMAEYMIEYREETGKEPLWAPNAFSGMPGYFISPKTIVPQVDDVFTALRSFLWPSSHLIVLLIGTYLLVVFLTRNKLSGVLAAIAYGFTTYLPVILVAGHNSKYIALAYAPWLVLSFAYALRRPGLLAGLLFAAALALNLRAGHIQPTYYISFLLGVWWIVEGVKALRSGEAAQFARTTGWLALGSVLGLMMIAQPYLSQAESKAYTIRGAASGGEAGGLDWEYAMNWSQGVVELLTLLIADAFGGAAAYWGPKPFTGGPHYVGGIVILLAGIALWRFRSTTVLVFGIGTLLMVLFSLGSNLPIVNRPMYELFPLFNALRAPETWLSTAAFALAVLAALGLWYLIRPEDSPAAEATKTRSLYIASGVLIGFVLLLLVMRTVFFDFSRPDEYQRLEQQLLAQQPELSADDPRVRAAIQQHLSQVEDQRESMFADDALRTLLFLIFGAGLLVLLRRGKLSAPVVQAGLALLVLLDLWGIGRRYLNEDRLVPESGLEQRIATYDYDRFLLEKQEEAGGMGHFRVLAYEGANPMMNARPSYYYESLGGYTGAKLRVYQDYIDHILFEAGRPNENALDLMNARFVVAPVALPGLEPVYQDPQTGMLVLENTDALPRAFFVQDVEVIAEPEEIWARLRDPAFDPAQTALLMNPLDLSSSRSDTVTAAEVTLESYSPREIVWSTATDQPRLLVASEVYYPAGWNAYIDGEPTEILQVDYLLRGVVVPAGEHRVEMRFEPSSHRTGVILSAIGTILVYGGIVVVLGLAYRRSRVES